MTVDRAVTHLRQGFFPTGDTGHFSLSWVSRDNEQDAVSPMEK